MISPASAIAGLLVLVALAISFTCLVLVHSINPSRRADDWDQIERSRSVMVVPSPSARVVAP